MRKSTSLVLLAFLCLPALATSWSRSFHFTASTIQVAPLVRDGQTFDLVKVTENPGPARQGLGVAATAEAGRPRVPCWTFTLVVPQGMRIARVDAEPRRTSRLPAAHRLFPAQPPVSLSASQPPFVPPDEAVYGADAAWPGVMAEAGPVGSKSGFRLATVTLYPLQYHPQSGRMELATSLEVTLHYEPDPLARAEFLTERQTEHLSRGVRALVINPEDVERHAPPRRRTDWGNVDCAIITSSALEPSFAPLVDWHNRKGYRTEVRTTAWINSNYTGRDLPEKIRNFIIDYYNTQGLMWVILGGDHGVVPARLARAAVGSDTLDLEADIYYADLQSSWDSDGDNIFGEYVEDSVDLYYDVYIGRMPVDNATQVSTIVNKTINHERTPPTGYLQRILLADAPLWTGYDHYQSNDSIAGITPAGWSDVHLHDPADGTTIRDSIDNGFQFVHLVGHGSETAVWNGGTQIYNTTAAGVQTNGSMVNLVNSIACCVGDYGFSDCLAEAVVNRSGGGSVASIMNSDFGWGDPPYMGPSEQLDVRFYDYFFQHDTMPIGITHAASKEEYRNASILYPVWRWCYYELNLHADPLLMMYEDIPTQLDATFTDPIGTGSQSFTVTVTASGSPVPGALVCLDKGTEVYARDFTNASGQLTVTINPATSGQMYVTATAANHLPDADSCQVLEAVQDVGSYRIAWPFGIIDSGDVVEPRSMVRNYSSIAALSIPVMFRIGSAYLAYETIPSLGPGDSAEVTFEPWTAGPGSYTPACSTLLAGDIDPSNDRSTRGLFVQYRDVGATAISVAATVDSGAVVPISTTVRNYGNTDETFDVSFTISSTGYAETRSKTLAAGSVDTVNFPAWTALERGSHTLACSTRLVEDMVPTNDRMTNPCFVRVTDVTCVAIVSPPGTVDSAPAISILAQFANLGNAEATFPARFAITGPSSWCDTASVIGLSPGDTTLIAFGNWVVGPRGDYVASCSTMAPGDQLPANDRITRPFAVVVRDAAAVGMLSPGPEVDTATTVPVRVTVANHGNIADNIDVTVTVGTQYAESTTVIVDPGAVDTVDLADWIVALPRGAWPATVTAYTFGDANPANDVYADSVTVNVHDAAVTALNAPTGVVDSGVVITPEAQVRNDGTAFETFDVYLTVADGYSSLRTVTLPPADDSVVEFAPWTALTPGTFEVRCTTLLTGDDNPGNDFLVDTVDVTGSDVGVVSIVSPVDLVDPGPVDPEVIVGNFSPTPREFPVFLTISNEADSVVYSDSADTPVIVPGDTAGLVFPSWNAYSGLFTVRCSTALPGDLNPLNDTASRPCRVHVHDVGVTEIYSPANSMRPTLITPRVRLWNFGTRDEVIPVHMTIRNSSTGDIVYVDSVIVDSLAAGQPLNVDLPPWPAPVGRYWVTSYSALPDDVVPVNDTAEGPVVISPGALGWQAKPDVPNMAVPVRHGGCLTGIEGTPSCLYALKGNKTTEFYRYDIDAGVWTQLPSMPNGASGRPVKRGADLCSDDERYVYAIKGNRTPEFYRFDTEAGTWTQLADLPGYRAPKYGSKIAHVRVNGADYVYFLKGSKTFEFYLYTVGNDSWMTLAPVPAGGSGRSYKKGSALCADGDSRLFLVKSRYNEFFVYEVAGGYWNTLTSLPMYGYSGKRAKTKDGCDITSDEAGQVYAFSGGNRDFFFVYGIASNSWRELDPVPLGPTGRKVKYGGSLQHLDRQVWALKGNKTCEFWVYTPDTMSVFLPPRPERTAQSGPELDATRSPAFSVSPNPSPGVVTVVSRSGEPARVRLYSPLGACLKEAALPPGLAVRLDLAGIPAGTYFVRLSAGGVTDTRKLIIQD